MRVLALLSLLVFAVGCAEKRDDEPSTEPPAPAPYAVVSPEPRVDEVLVTVNGATLTQGELDRELQLRMLALRKQTRPEQAAAFKASMRNHIIEQFIMRSLLLQEAERRRIEITSDDEKKAYDEIRAKLPAGTSLEQILQQSPMGEARMREEVLVGIRINKLLDSQLTNDTPVSSQEVAQYRAKNPARLTVPETVRARHILLAVKKDADEETRSGTRERIEALRGRLLGGADFAAVATEHSDCPSKEKGGDLGSFRRGQMVKPFEDAAFSQDIDVVGAVIETRFGYHIIQVLEHKEPRQVPDAEIRKMLARTRRQSGVKAYIAELKSSGDIVYGLAARPGTAAPNGPLQPAPSTP